MNQDGNWLSLVEYSHLSRISISTLRRMIKRNELRYREESGRYLIYSKIKKSLAKPLPMASQISKLSESLQEERTILELRLEVERLKQEIIRYAHENNELKMLVDLYENQINLNPETLPELPV